MVETIYTSPGFETGFRERLLDTVAQLPAGAAELHLAKKPCGSKAFFPSFRIIPSNQRSAVIEGIFAEGDGINFVVGQATSHEIYVTSEMEEKDKTQEDEFFRICQAVFTTRFSEKLIYSYHDKVIRSRIVLNVNGRQITLGVQQAFWWLFPKKTRKRFDYEPYY